jgi:hypothetical protein
LIDPDLDMQLTAYDPARVILLSLHVGEPLSDSDVDRIVEGTHRAAADAARHGGIAVTTLIIIESQHSATALQRRRMGAAMALVRRGHTAFVVRSALIRGMITAIGWLSMSDASRERIQSTHSTYGGARGWLVERSGHPASTYDAMERELRSSADGLGLPSGVTD